MKCPSSCRALRRCIQSLLWFVTHLRVVRVQTWPEGWVWNVLRPHSTTALVGGTLVRDDKSGWRWDVGDFTVVWGQGFTELAWKELRAGQTPWGREQRILLC